MILKRLIFLQRFLRFLNVVLSFLIDVSLCINALSFTSVILANLLVLSCVQTSSCRNLTIFMSLTMLLYELGRKSQSPSLAREQ